MLSPGIRTMRLSEASNMPKTTKNMRESKNINVWQCSKLVPVLQSETGKFPGGLTTFSDFSYHFMLVLMSVRTATFLA